MRQPLSSRLLVISFAVLAFSVAAAAQRGGNGNNPIASLKGLPVPQPDLSQYVVNRDALIVLGKALFWDAQVGSDGTTACATCHFHAGADHRVTNTIAGSVTSTAAVRANTTLTAADFPFHTFAVPNDNTSALTRDRHDVVGSTGLVLQRFVGVSDASPTDVGADGGSTGLFTIGGTKVRQVTSRNAPSVINAVFNLRNFWDGRASNIFNAGTPFGPADARTSVLVLTSNGLAPELVRLDRSSLASQAVGPPLNGTEMSYDGRQWADLGRKMLSLTPLARQQIAFDDSVLGPYTNAGGVGLRGDASYAALISAAFQPAYWRGGADQMASNFGLFFGLAVQAYESSLISDDTPVDRFLAGDTTALSDTQQQGLNEFRTGGSQCTQCHQGPELSAAGVGTASRGNLADPRALGFFRTGVSAVEDDPGTAGVDAFGAPLFPAAPGGRAVGAFKAPGLRNVELTGPYFHTGGSATLEQVLDFYARNGDVPDGGNLGPGIGNIRLNQNERAQIVEFLKALTDDRVRFERAPFDHPSLCVPTGYNGSATAEMFALVPPVGRNGNTVPLQTFSEQLTGVGRDGSRAHSLERPCSP
jgi:cytochrome c peroxidase